MIYKAKTTLGEDINLGTPFSVTINKDENVPADDLIAIFPYLNKTDELNNIYVYENKNLVFSGIIDEQQISCDLTGCYLKISARSFAAYLIDNEATPQTYYSPSLKVIFERHIKPYGFTKINGNLKTFSDEFIVTKGMSEWEVLETFCTNFLNCTPKITVGGTRRAINATLDKNEIIIKNDATGINYYSIKSELKRYKLISEVFVKSAKSLNYDVAVNDIDSIKGGVKRRRFLNATNNTTKTAVSYAEKMISSGKKNSFLVTALCPGYVLASIGNKALLDDKILGKINNLIVSKIKYSFENSQEKSEIIMRLEE